jgi:hypothetical protein
MKTMKCLARVDENHQTILQLPHDITPGEYQIMVAIAEATAGATSSPQPGSDEFKPFVAAGESSLDFWDNPMDDEVWNLA